MSSKKEKEPKEPKEPRESKDKDSSKSKSDTFLPLSRVKVIMKSSAEIDSVPNDALYLITKSTELFIQHLTQESFKMSNGKSLDYKNISDLVEQESNLEFLKDIVVPKMTARDALKLMGKHNAMMHKEMMLE